MSEQLSQTSPGASSSLGNDTARQTAKGAASAAVDDTTKPAVVVVEEDDDDGPDSDADALRRRRRRRRRRSLKTDNPERRIRIFLLALVVVLLILAITGAQAGSWLKGILASAKSSGQFHGLGEIARKFMRWDVIALIVAAIVLLYLQPGVEEKILRYLGIKKDRRR